MQLHQTELESDEEMQEYFSPLKKRDGEEPEITEEMVQQFKQHRSRQRQINADMANIIPIST